MKFKNLLKSDRNKWHEMYKNNFVFVSYYTDLSCLVLDFQTFAALSLNLLTLSSMEVGPERTFFSLLGPLTGPRAKKV
jgi:hypothetical protein